MKEEEKTLPTGQNQENKAPAKAVQNEHTAPRRQEPPRRPRRPAGPQIYGQNEGMPKPQMMYGQQGMIRREVPAHQDGATGQPTGAQRQPVNRAAGQPMGGQGQPMNRAAGQPMNMQGRPMNAGQAAYKNGRIESSRSVLKSPILILVALLNTVCLAGAVAAVFLHEMNYTQFIRLISDINMPAQLAGYMESVKKLLGMLDSGMLPVNLALQIPGVFLCIGLWLICITGRTADEEMSGIGFVFMKIFVVIKMIFTCAVVLIGLILSVTLVVAAWVSGTNSMILLAGVMLAVMIITALAVIMYYFCYLATLKAIRLNASTGEPYGQVSVYVAIVHVILGLSGIVGLLSGIVNAEISNIAGSIGKIGWMLLFAVWIYLYKGKMSEFED